MNITIYVALAIILLLIIIYICLKYYLINTHSTEIKINDNSPILNNCIYNHDVNILYCNYIVDKKKIILTKMLKNKFKTNPFIFNSKNYNLPDNGILKIRYVCDTCNGIKRGDIKNSSNSIRNSGDSIRNSGNSGDSIRNSDKNAFTISPSEYNSFFINNNKTIEESIENEYDNMTEDYVANRANYNKKNSASNGDDYPTPFNFVHSSSTQNALFWDTNTYEKKLENILNPNNYNADMLSIGKSINSSINNNNIDSTLYDIEKIENSISRDFVKDSPMSYTTNIFNRKYPKSSKTSILANIDPEYIHGGLRGDAKLVN